MPVVAALLEALGLIVPAAAPSTRLPTDATLKPSFATTIASDPARRKAAHAFWSAQFTALGENPFGAADSPALALGTALPDDDLSTMFPDRAHLTNAADLTAMVRRSGCLVSLAEMATAIDPAGTAATLLADVQAFDTAVTGAPGAPVDVAQVARGIRACRELFDAARRLAACSATGLDLAVALALYRQEGALAIGPPVASFPHAPLIETAAGRCRTPVVSLWDTSAKRPGFSLVFTLRHGSDPADNDDSKRFEALYRSLMVTGGLDTIANPRLFAGNPAKGVPSDELLRLHAAARAAVPRPAAIEDIETALRMKFKATDSVGFGAQRKDLDNVVIGLAMAALDGGGATPTVDTLLTNVRTRLTDLIAAHDFEQRKRSGHRDIHLLEDIHATATVSVLAVQGDWFSSRGELATLVARADRPAVTGATLSPFLTYLRFHSGDAIFMGVLLRAVSKLDRLVDDWTAHPEWGTELPDRFGAATWDATEGAAIGGLVTSHWRPHVGKDTAWRHIGLTADLAAAGPLPAWLTPAPAPVNPLKTTAEVARRCVEAIESQGLMGSLEAALSLTPIDSLRARGVLAVGTDPRLIAVNTHSFERLRLAYADAIAAAGL